MEIGTTNPIAIKIISFYKEGAMWFADIPSYLEKGLGTKANLLMVDGADTFLDYISFNSKKATLKVSDAPFVDAEFKLLKMGLGLNLELLKTIGHAFVDYGAYYSVTNFKNALYNHQLWLCPVAEYVFDGAYPLNIYIQLLKNI